MLLEAGEQCVTMIKPRMMRLVEYVAPIGERSLTVLKIRAFWDVAPCNLGVDRSFRGAFCLHHQGDDPSQYAPLKRRSTPTTLHGATSQKDLIFILAAVKI
jgi:hypothetical protein